MLVAKAPDSLFKKICAFLWFMLWDRENEESRPLIDRGPVITIRWPYREVIAYYPREEGETEEEYARTLRIREEMIDINERPSNDAFTLWI